MLRQLLLVAALLFVLQGGAFALLARAKNSDVRPLHDDLNDVVQMEFGTTDGSHWRSAESTPDDEIIRTTGARHAISRLYVNEAGRGISVHIGDWNSLQHPTLPHPPWICYPANGAQIVGEEPFVLNEEDVVKENAIPQVAKILTVENKGMRSLVLYWYAWEDRICTTRWDATKARLSMLGSREWPPVIKVMLETPAAPSQEEAMEAITDFAAKIREMTRSL